jgi:hypothetical protein
MMTCREFAESMVDFCDKDLDPAHLQASETHCRQCPECALQYQSYLTTRQICRRALEIPIPPKAQANLHHYIQNMMAKSPEWPSPIAAQSSL